MAVNVLPDKAGASHDLDILLRVMEEFSFESIAPKDLQACLPELQRAYARLVKNCVRAGLALNIRYTPKHPHGQVLIHPAMKYLIGDQNLTATDAKRQLKKILEMEDTVELSTNADPIMDEIYQKVLGRPSGDKKSE